MATFHIDPNTGDPRSCSRPDSCGWANAEEHYPTAADARAAYEVMMSDYTIPKVARS